jgi:hypothetical protein
MICCFDTVDLRNGVPHLLRDAALEVFSWWSWKCLVIASLWSLAPFWFLSPWSASTAFGFLLLLYWVLFLPSGCRRALFRLASWAADPSWLDVVSLSTDSRSRSFNSNEWWFLPLRLLSETGLERPWGGSHCLLASLPPSRLPSLQGRRTVSRSVLTRGIQYGHTPVRWRWERSFSCPMWSRQTSSWWRAGATRIDYISQIGLQKLVTMAFFLHQQLETL